MEGVLLKRLNLQFSVEGVEIHQWADILLVATTKLLEAGNPPILEIDLIRIRIQ